MDALLREEMRHELKEMVSALDITAVFVTHDQTEAMSMSDQIAVLNGGVAEQFDTLNEKQLFRPESAGTKPSGDALHYELFVHMLFRNSIYKAIPLYNTISIMILAYVMLNRVTQKKRA